MTGRMAAERSPFTAIEQALHGREAVTLQGDIVLAALLGLLAALGALLWWGR